MINSTIFKFEILRNRTSTLVWTGVTAGIILLLMLAFPLMMGIIPDYEMQYVEGYGYTRVDTDLGVVGTSIGYFAFQYGLLQLVGVMFASLLGFSILSSEERDKTAEFLLTQPITRASIWFSKFAAFATLIAFFTLAHLGFAFLLTLAFNGIAVTGMNAQDIGAFGMITLTSFLLFITIGFLCYWLSSYYNRKGGVGVALGISLGSYFLFVLALTLVSELLDGGAQDAAMWVLRLFPYYASNPGLVIGVYGQYGDTSGWYFGRGVIGLGVFTVATSASLILGFNKFKTKDIF
ncbi:MAG: ABC transporter permease [Firmicutes bacterium]|nr:ABC transporter permease [Bacillota bacterium]